MSIFSVAGWAAISIDDYQKQLSSAHLLVRGMRDTASTNHGVAVVQGENVEAVRNFLPAGELVDWPGGTSEVNNSWMYADLDLYTAETVYTKQKAILDRIDDRMTSIEAAVAEARIAVTGGRTKDADKNKLAEILSRQEYQKPAEGSESIFQRLRSQLIEWLKKMFPAVHMDAGESAGLESLATLLQFLLYAALAAGIAFLLYRFLPFFRRRTRGGSSGRANERVIMGERVAADTSSADLFAEAERLARNGELRLAIRKGYVALLCELSDRKLIGLARHKTNRDYLRDLRPRRDLFENVRGLTGSFERHWYGSESSAESDWEEFRSLYRETVGKA